MKNKLFTIFLEAGKLKIKEWHLVQDFLWGHNKVDGIIGVIK